MGLVSVLKLSILLLSCFVVLGDELDVLSWTRSPHQPPIYPPVGAPHKPYPPTQPPVHPPRPSHPHPPTQPPVHPPRPSHPHPPVHPPSPSPTPSYPIPTRKLVAVQGVVYCKSCKYTGVDTLLGATPLLGAVVKLQCNNTKYPSVQQSKTDKNGYFFFLAPNTVTTYGSHKCKVFLVSSPLATCNKPTNLHFGLQGAILRPTNFPAPPPKPLPFQVFTVGPFAFEPSNKAQCPR